MKDAVGYRLSGCNAEALDLMQQALYEFRCYSARFMATAEAALAHAPNLVMARVLRAYANVLATEAPAVEAARADVAAARALPHDEREAMHLAAIEHLSNNQWRAGGRVLEDLSIDYPLDALALQAGQQVDFFTGDARMLRDRIARVLPYWSTAVPGYHAVLGMAAFGLEETGDYERAEVLGRRAIELEPLDAWAQHAVAHVMEMRGRRDEGIRWMRGNDGWQKDNFLAVHNWWHLALYHMGRGELDQVLALYDGPIFGHRPQVLMELLDASALLWRLELAGGDVGDRWSSLAEQWLPQSATGHYAFNDMHAAMALARAGRRAELKALVAAQEAALRKNDDNAQFTAEVGAPATRAMIAFIEGDYARTVDLLRGIRSQSHRFGGSLAQRDLLDQTLIAAAHRGGQQALARALEVERRTLAEQRSRRGTAVH